MNNLLTRSTCFEHKGTWKKSPGNVINITQCVIISARHATSIIMLEHVENQTVPLTTTELELS